MAVFWQAGIDKILLEPAMGVEGGNGRKSAHDELEDPRQSESIAVSGKNIRTLILICQG